MGKDFGMAVLGVVLVILGIVGIFFAGTYFIAHGSRLPSGSDIIDNTMAFLTVNSNSPIPTLVWGVVFIICIPIGIWLVKYSLTAPNK